MTDTGRQGEEPMRHSNPATSDARAVVGVIAFVRIDDRSASNLWEAKWAGALR